MSSFLYRIGRASYRARGRVVAAWLLIVVLLGGLSLTIGGAFDDSFTIPNAPSTIALDRLKASFPEAADSTATVLVTVADGSRLEDRSVKPKVEQWLKKFEDLSFVRGTIGEFDVDLVREFFQGMVNHAAMTVHVDALRGDNAHHQAETVFKAFGRALRMAVEIDPRATGIPSTKGTL